MTSVLFGQSYFLRFDPKLHAAMRPYPPLGALYAAAVLRGRGHAVSFFDAMLAASEDEWAQALDAHRPRVAVLYEDSFNYLSKMCLLRMRAAAFTMTQMARARGCTVVVSGSDATDHLADYFAHGADYIIIGEGEQTLAELADYLSDTGHSEVRAVTTPIPTFPHSQPQRTGEGVSSLSCDAADAAGLRAPPRLSVSGPKPLTSASRGRARVGETSTSEVPALSIANDERPGAIAGLAYRDETGAIVRTSPRGFMRDLDALPFPAWDLVDVPRYRRAWRERHGAFSMNLVTTRGCPYHCNWCAKPIYGQRYNARSPENVVAEMRELDARYAPDEIEFADDIFGLKPGWIERFADLVESEDLHIPFKCLLRADLVSERVAAALARAGCRIVWMGAESGSQKVLDAMEKGTRVEEIYAATERLHRAGVRVAFFLQYGYRGEDRADIERTLQMVRDCQPDDIGISVSYPLPGTRFYERVKSELGDKQNWNDSDDLAMLYRGTYSQDFYRVLYRVTHAEFRLRGAARALSGVRAAPAAWRPRHLRQLASLPVNAVRLRLERRRLDVLERRDACPSGHQAGA